ncbi:MAG TPA: ribose 5-phosphate isomerase A, partial [Syntrophales bacterium]|nr:ribose 5-phosphate isomerase A [Syntrophales bacterium]HQG35240.1 ribose 5-phosphate isomerase A [Syntrophales bacterium]HQI36738.1 ribose 5-phosphate isomerase A [Syntrophales bacterium]
MQSDVTDLKKNAAAYAVGLIESGMVVGLGHGSTAIYAVRFLAERLKTGEIKNVLGIPCSLQVEEEAMQYGMPLTSFEKHPVMDITIDGADEIDIELNLIKGGGGALLREKIVAQASRRVVIVLDESKCSPFLGKQRKVPVEIVAFGWNTHVMFLESLGAKVRIRRNADNSLYHTDQGNLIADCNFHEILNPRELAAKIKT